MMRSGWRHAVLAAVEELVITMGYPILQYIEVAHAMVQRRQAQASQAEHA